MAGPASRPLSRGRPVPPAGPEGTTNGMAVASLVCGILGLVLFWACFVGLVISIVAVVLGVVGRSKAKQLPGESGSGVALAGMITGVVGTLVGIVMVVLLFVGDDDDHRLRRHRRFQLRPLRRRLRRGPDLAGSRLLN